MPKFRLTLLCYSLVAFVACDDSAPRPGDDDTDDTNDEQSIDGDLDASVRDGSMDAARKDASAPDAALDASVDASVEGGADAGVTMTRVTVANGELAGALLGTTRVFMDVPYARAQRFAVPQPAEPWQGVRDATKPGAICPQPTPDKRYPGVQELPQSEDCLHLNVWSQADAHDAPVVVFIHGGSGVTGAGSDYNGRYLSENGELVVVTINYRLGPLGNLTLPLLDGDVPSGNYALRDQQAALRWVHDNIRSFGGDPAKVTLFGQSAGASHSCLQLFATGNDGLFQRVITESAGCVNSSVSPQTRVGVEAVSQDFLNAFCNEADDTLACLRGLDANEVVNWKSTRGSLQELLGPYVDGKLLTDHPLKLVRAGKFQHVPVIAGSNTHEGNFLQSPFWGQKWPMVNNGLELLIGVGAMYPNDVTSILVHYGLPATDADANRIMVAIIDDSWFHCPARALARELSKQQQASFLYRFDVAPAVHILELEYVFGLPKSDAALLYPSAPNPPLPSVVKSMQTYWSSFARTGDPNATGLLAWPKYAPNTLLRIADPLALDTQVDAETCDFWDELLEARVN
jgi:para-nitrobenzyl esterase